MTVHIPIALLDDLIRRPAAEIPRERNCLTCSRPFISDGPHHRVCDKCKSGRDTRMEFVN